LFWVDGNTIYGASMRQDVAN